MYQRLILEIDADEIISEDLGAEIINNINNSDTNFYNIKVDNYIGQKLVKYGWGATFGRGGVLFIHERIKIWGNQRGIQKLNL